MPPGYQWSSAVHVINTVGYNQSKVCDTNRHLQLAQQVMCRLIHLFNYSSLPYGTLFLGTRRALRPLGLTSHGGLVTGVGVGGVGGLVVLVVMTTLGPGRESGGGHVATGLGLEVSILW
jgi:hypothetical protein